MPLTEPLSGSDSGRAPSGKIPGLLHLEIRQAFNGMDYALYSEFESQDALRAYAVHPLHLEAKTHFTHLLAQRVAADYEV